MGGCSGLSQRQGQGYYGAASGGDVWQRKKSHISKILKITQLAGYLYLVQEIELSYVCRHSGRVGVPISRERIPSCSYCSSAPSHWLSVRVSVVFLLRAEDARALGSESHVRLGGEHQVYRGSRRSELDGQVIGFEARCSQASYVPRTAIPAWFLDKKVLPKANHYSASNTPGLGRRLPLRPL